MAFFEIDEAKGGYRKILLGFAFAAALGACSGDGDMEEDASADMSSDTAMEETATADDQSQQAESAWADSQSDTQTSEQVSPWGEEDSWGDDAYWDEDQEEVDDGDPLEGMNRVFFAINEGLDTVLFRPAAATYRFLLPEFVRDGIRNFFRNMSAPIIFINDVLQGEFGRAGDTSARFLINSTVGIGGLFDFADDWGIPFHDEDFGQTLGVWGMGEAGYLVLPILGPSSTRDGIGIVVDSFMDPMTYVLNYYGQDELLIARMILPGLDKRSRNIETLEDLKRDSIDFYARIRSLYRQRREAEIKNGEEVIAPTPGFSGQEDQGAELTPEGQVQ